MKKESDASFRMVGGYYGGSAALLPLGNRRSVPSKWEDAEKWICSPVYANTPVHGHHPVRRRPKSKSGPLGPHCASAGVHVDVDDDRAKTFTANSPTLRPEDGVFGDGTIYTRGGGGVVPGSTTVPGWSQLLMEASSSSLPASSYREEKSQITQDSARRVLNILKNDVGTQMSPQGSTCSSPNAKSQTPSHPSHSLTIGELRKHFSKLEVRDVQVDDQVSTNRWSKRHFPRVDKSSLHAKQCKKGSLESNDSAWEVPKTGKCMSRVETEEARIIAWENLQKAKAEAAIRELEMKLEKKRSSSMDKILNKLSSAQKKAEDMRKSCRAQQADDTSNKASLLRKINRLHFLNGCFYSHAV